MTTFQLCPYFIINIYRKSTNIFDWFFWQIKMIDYVKEIQIHEILNIGVKNRLIQLEKSFTRAKFLIS